jgi:hypothetical protein
MTGVLNKTTIQNPIIFLLFILIALYLYQTAN